MPKRIQRRRTKGWRLPENARCVTRPSRWGNPYTYGMAVQFRRGVYTVLTTPEGLVRAFREYAGRCLELDPDWLEPLRGKDLACYCPPGAPCHADVLLQLANPDDES